MESICFKRSQFTLYLVLITCILVYLVYVLYYKYKENSIKENLTDISYINSKIQNLQDQLFQTQIRNQTCNSDLLKLRELRNDNQQQILMMNRIYNPLVSPERTYPGGRLYSQNQYNDYQQIGFIYNDQERFPLYGRPKYPGKSDKYEYYLIDESRNHLKIPYKPKGDNEIYDGDQIFVDVLNNSFSVKIYDYDNIRYNPTI